jgi:hypothetical protein
MKIEVYCLVSNEEIMLSYFMRHYIQFAKVILLESNSKDKTKEIAYSMGAEIWIYDWPDQINDQIFTEVKNNCWKQSAADWIMVTDVDEFIYHPDLINALEKTKSTIIRPDFYNMYSETFPKTKKQIYDEVKKGIIQFEPPPKMNVFKRSEIQEMNYAPGCHHANPTGNVIINSEGFKTLHMRNLSKEYILSKNASHSRRRSDINKLMRWGDHVDTPADEVCRKFDESMKVATKII